MLNLADLATMAVIVSEGSLQAAAEKLHKTPSAISQTLKRLESDFGLQLFDRSGYRITLTDQGAALYKRSLPLLKEAHQLEQFAALLSSGQESRFTVTVHSVIPDEFYLSHLCELGKQFPDTVLCLLKEGFESPMQRLRDETSDLVIVCGNSTNCRMQEVESLHLGKVELIHVIHRQLLGECSAGEIIAADLKDCRQIVVSENHGIDSESAGISIDGNVWYVNDQATKISLITEGQGWGHLSRGSVREAIASGDLVALDADNGFQPFDLDIWALRKSGRSWGVVASTLWALLTP